jgi:hypothetical protein
MITIPITQSQRSIKESAPTTRSEIELLLFCARTHIDPAISERIKELLQQDIDWISLIQTATHHGVMPLLYWSLKATCPEVIPQSILSQLRNHFLANALRNLFLTRELLKLLKLFEDYGIPAIPFKGPILATSIYSNPELRQFKDLDILVNPNDKIKASELLVSQEYQLELDYGWQQTFIHSKKNVVVDLHWTLTPPPSEFPFQLPEFETLLQQTRPLALNGKTVNDFSPDFLLIILTVQVTRGGFEERESLSQICDLAELIRLQQTTDWERILQQVRMLGLCRPFFISLHLVKTLLNSPLPTIVKQAIQQQMRIDPVISIYSVRMQKQLFSKINSPRIITLFFQMLLARGPLSRLPPRIYLLCQFLIIAIRLVSLRFRHLDRGIVGCVGRRSTLPGRYDYCRTPRANHSHSPSSAGPA